MLVAFVNERDKSGVIIASFVSRKQAVKERVVSGDLIFQDSGEIDQSPDWLFSWETENSYARRQQKANLNIKDFRLSVP